MKKQKKLRIKVRDLEPLKDVIGGRRHAQGLHAQGLRADPSVLHSDGRGLGPFGFNRPQ